MPTIDEVLSATNPADVVPPTVDELRKTIRSRRQRRQVGTGLVVGVAVLGGFAIGFRPPAPGDGQRVDAVGQDTTPSSVDTTPPTTEPDAEDIDAEDEDAAPAQVVAPPSVRRWFLAPEELPETRYIQSSQQEWSAAQGSGPDQVIVTTDPANPATAGLARVYHLDDIGLSITDGPEEFTETFRDVDTGESIVRVGSDPERDSVKAFVESERGIYAVIGIGITEGQAITLALVAELVDGKISVGDNLGDGLFVAEPPPSADTDHTTYLSWGTNGNVRLEMRPDTIESAAIGLRWLRSAEVIEVRDTDGLYVPLRREQEPAAIAWEEDGYVFTLSSGDDRTEVSVENLVAAANSLQRIGQPGLVELFDDSFMRTQQATVASWFEATPLPPGWDAEPLIHGIPQGEQQLASYLQQLLACGWIAEWGDAIREDDQPRRTTAESIMAERGTWPVALAEVEAFRQIDPNFAESRSVELEGMAAQAEEMVAVSSVEELEAFETKYGCGFSVPG